MIIKKLDNFLSRLSKYNHITIISHLNPDGDAVGSSLAIHLLLKEMNIASTIILPNQLPDFLQWLPNIEIINYFEKNPEECKKIIQKSELLILLDFNSFSRVGNPFSTLLENVQKDILLIDHHQTPKIDSIYSFVNTSISSTCENIYHLIEELNLEKYITTDIATSLYTGIVTDTGMFKFPMTTYETHYVVSQLMLKNINITDIHRNLYDSNSLNKIKLLGEAIQRIVKIKKHKVGYIGLDKEVLRKYNYQKGFTEGIVNYITSISDIDFGAIFIEDEEKKIIKISFRSKNKVNVNIFAEKYFNGGGHLNAAGGISKLSIQETIKYFKECVTEFDRGE